MAAIKDTAAIARKWSEVTPLRSGDYEAGVQQPGKDWARETAGSADAWKAGVALAVAEGRFAKGVQRAGTEKWQQQTLSKGVARWGPGVAGAANAYAEGFDPYRQAIAALTLPPRFARQDPRNLERVKAVVNTMIATKKART